MSKGKRLTIDQIRQIVYFELLDLTNGEIAAKLNLNTQTVDRSKGRDDYLSLKKMLAEKLLAISTSELLVEF